MARGQDGLHVEMTGGGYTTKECTRTGVQGAGRGRRSSARQGRGS